jgi:hypothetical protein
VAALAIAFGVEPLHSIVAHVPVLAGIKNSRMIYLATFGIAGLAGLGISKLEKETRLTKADRVLALVFVMVAFAVIFLLVYDLRLATEIRVEFMRRPSFSRALLIAGLIPLLLRLYRGFSASMFSVAACVVVAFDLISFSYGFMGFSRPDEIFPSARIFDFLKENADPARFRVAQISAPYPANANVMYQIASPDGYEVKVTPWQRAFSFDYMNEGIDGIFFTGGRLLRSNDRRLDMLNVKYLTVATSSPEFMRFKTTNRFALAYNSGDVSAFENKTVLPRAFLVPASGVKVLPGFDNQLALLRDPTLDPQKTAVVSRLPAGLTVEEHPSAGISGLPLTNNVEITASGINEIKLRATAPTTSVLILSQTHYPGWKAEVDGKRTEVFPVNIALTGIQVPAGLHEIRFDFLPVSFETGAALTLASVLTLLALLRTGFVRQRE